MGQTSAGVCTIPDLLNTATRLRQVRAAKRRFLLLWAMDMRPGDRPSRRAERSSARAKLHRDRF